MSKRIIPVTLEEFELLVKLAEEKHYMSNEPIPKLSESGISKLESSLSTPFQNFGGYYPYRGLIKKASILFYLLNKNHCLVNGNKRMACLCIGYFFYINGYRLNIPQDLFYRFAKSVVISDAKYQNKALAIIRRTFRDFIEKIPPK